MLVSSTINSQNDKNETKGKFDEKDLVIRHSNDTKERKLPPKR